MSRIDDAIGALNSMLAADPVALQALIEHRVPCTEALAEHPTCQVSDDDAVPTVGMLGILNGIFGKGEAGWGYICAELDNGKLVRFKRTPQADNPEVQAALEKLKAEHAVLQSKHDELEAKLNEASGTIEDLEAKLNEASGTIEDATARLEAHEKQNKRLSFLGLL